MFSDHSVLGRFFAEHSSVQAVAWVLASLLWSADSARDWKRGRLWISISWWVIGIAILLIVGAGFVKDKQWLALAIVIVGLAIQGMRFRKLFQTS